MKFFGLILVSLMAFNSAYAFDQAQFYKATWGMSYDYKNADIGTVKNSLLLSGEVKFGNHGKFCVIIVGPNSFNCEYEAVYANESGIKGYFVKFTGSNKALFEALKQTARRGPYGDKTISYLEECLKVATENFSLVFAANLTHEERLDITDSIELDTRPEELVDVTVHFGNFTSY